MKTLWLVVLLATGPLVRAQFTLDSCSPALNSTDVPLTTSISLTFSAALDTTYPLGMDNGIFWNIDDVTGRSYSPDLRTITFDVSLSPSTVYVVAVYFARALSGATLQTPHGLVFTTASSFPPYSVSGNVLSGSTGVPPANSLVILSSTPIMNGKPHMVTGTIADANGAFVLPHVASGTFYPVAAKDVDGDGRIEPGDVGGDVVAIGDPVTVDTTNVTGINLVFFHIAPVSFSEARAVADSISALLPPDKSLRSLGGWGIDSTGRSHDWEFVWLRDGLQEGYRLRVGRLEQRLEALDSMEYGWYGNNRPLNNPGTAADASVFMANVESNGGFQFRTQPPGGNYRFQSYVNLGDLRWTGWGWLVPDTSLNYWGASYEFGYDSSHHWTSVYEKRFVGDYATGSILVVTDVAPEKYGSVPVDMALLQNYPNPFNPTTEIRFSLPRSEWTTLKVYNLLGQEVAVLAQGVMQAGEYAFRFDGSRLTSGMYFYRLATASQTITKRMILVR